MSSPDRHRNKQALVSDKIFGKRNITPTKSKLQLTTSQSNKLVASPARSVSPARNLNGGEQNFIGASTRSIRPPLQSQATHQKPRRLIDHSETESLIDKLIKNREQICSCLQLYDLLYANGAPLRCLLHNNFASLYCENEQKQLCVNCVYGNIQHKLHRVTPVKNVMPQIVLDIDLMSRKVGKVMDGINQLEKISMQNLLDVDQELSLSLKTLEVQFERIHKALIEKYAMIRETIIDNFSETRIKNDIILQQVKVLKDIYNDHSLHSPHIDDESTKLYKHMMLGILVNQAEKFDGKMLKKFNGQETRISCLRDLIRLREQCEANLTASTLSPRQQQQSPLKYHQTSQSKYY